MSFDMSQYLGVFLDEAEEQIQELDEVILGLEQDGNDPNLLNRIFRAVHTLKGSSASMGFEKLATLTHAMENVLDKLRHGELTVHRGLIDLLLECLDALRLLKAEIAGGEASEVDIAGLSSRLKAAESAEELPPSLPSETGWSIELNDIESNVIHAAEVKGYHAYHVIVTLEEGCLMKAARAYIVFNNLKDLGEVIKTVPCTEDIEAEKFERSFQLILVTTEDADTVENTIKLVSEIASVELYPVTMAGECAGGNASEGVLAAPEVAAGTDIQHEQRVEKKAQTVRVDVQRLESLMNLVGELVIDRTRLSELGGRIRTNHLAGETLENLEEVSTHIGRITGELQEEIMKARMFPIEQVFNRFPRMVRDLALKAGKEVEFIVEGRETELDRTVIEEIGDPLIHLLRNAVDHGLEPPEERLRLGKPRQGTIKLRASHQENQIVITVEDDGHGMDGERIRNKALEKGLITREAAARLSNREAVNLIFLPGFSTAEKVSDVSGRGVGMDIVRDHVEKINGLINIDTEYGMGTRFTIKLPLTLAINRSLLVHVRDKVFAIPLANVVEIVNVEQNSIQRVQQREVVLLRGEVLPLLSLEKILGFIPSERKPGERLSVVVVGLSERRLGLVVDRLLGEQEIVIKSLGDFVGQVPGLAGATIMGDGSVALILDVRGLLVDRFGLERQHEFLAS